MKNICVYCGSNGGTRPEYAAAARAMGDALVREGIGLVYGGAHLGLMGTIADRVLAGGGEVTGVMPQALAAREIAHRGLTRLHVVGSMHERKALMAELADGFIAMPGGMGTLDELFEMLTWGQLGLHGKPCGLLNTLGYFDMLLRFVAHATEEGFMPKAHLGMLPAAAEPEKLLELMKAYTAPTVTKWIRKDET